ncbi:MAG: methylated-DNA--[protein]-cysteine S-methyltransferase [Gammaproteobacteria bacterium]|nr:methylated-DNA--[protein]-cysteine S-methyltransferase [Gammaproteobacteria bacterium]MCP4278005.1 methylated-DNA--[protein]-cysteine S-methyltransferase [Gammaproteobacteria bacterium]MCP4833007.1 methylated-DNA--[protein]-cysteine S-methyltransferase [Gammaproteobacteria bacterium]MCP4928621.1 methylated-DNA--[protein]-cysteine S-methyltransferase [Gammaproteobacteria bacterium]
MYPIEYLLDQGSNFQMIKCQRGKDHLHENIVYGFGESDSGSFLIAFSEQGLCWFEPQPTADSSLRLIRCWMPAVVTRDDQWAQQKLLDFLGGGEKALNLHLCGTAFQLRVWEALLCIPCGGRVTYGDLAAMLGNHKAAGALGGAVGANHIAILVPCHRVVPAAGGIGGYRWGSALKQQLLDREAHIKHPGIRQSSSIHLQAC